MPPKGARLSNADVDSLREWIDQGAPWIDGFTFGKKHRRASLAPREPALPPGNKHDNPIDQLLAPYFKKHGVANDRVISPAAFRRGRPEGCSSRPPSRSPDASRAPRCSSTT